MSNLTKVGIIILFLGLVLFLFQFIDIPSVKGEENYRELRTIQFNVDENQTLYPTINNQEIINNLNDISFLIRGKLISNEKGIEFGLKFVIKDGKKITLDNPLFIIKPPVEINPTKEYSDGYLVKPRYPQELMNRDFSISYDYDMLRNYVYDGFRSDVNIQKDITSKSDKGLTISGLRNTDLSILSLITGQTTLFISIGLAGLGLLFIILGILNKTKKETEELSEELVLEKEVEDMILSSNYSLGKDVRQRFDSINNRLKRIIKLSRDTSNIDLSEVLHLCKILVDNGIRLAKFMVGFTKIKDIANLENQKFELDNLKVGYTKESDFNMKTEILSKIKAKERVIFFLSNIDKKSEQIDKMIENVDAILESAILSFPSMKKDSVISSTTSYSSLIRKLKNEIQIQEKELEMLENVTGTDKSQSSKQIES
jgi:hypothetical protein